MPTALPTHTITVIFHQLFDLGRDVRSIAKEHSVSERAIRKWRLNWQVLGSALLSKGVCKTGRSRCYTLAQEKALIDYINDDPTIYLDEMAWFLFDYFGVRLSIASIFRILE